MLGASSDEQAKPVASSVKPCSPAAPGGAHRATKAGTCIIQLMLPAATGSTALARFSACSLLSE